MDYIEDIEYATSFYDKDEAKEIIRISDDIDYKYKIAQYEGTFVIQIFSRENNKFLGYYSE